jgi:hypothetical protein
MSSQLKRISYKDSGKVSPDALRKKYKRSTRKSIENDKLNEGNKKV